MRRRHFAFRVGITLVLVTCAVFATVVSVGRTRLQTSEVPQEFGVTFSPRMVRFYGNNDPIAAFHAVLNDLGVRRIRLPIYWDDVEATRGNYDFSDIDPYMAAATRVGAKVTLVIGIKTPRWPECHVPDWVGDNPRDALFEYLDVVVSRYKDHFALLRWQVENEYNFPFGECAAPDLQLFNDEVAFVRHLDPNTPIQLTVSGEQELWANTAGPADVIGASMYRFAWNPTTGLVVFPHPPEFYRLQAATVAYDVDRVVISELQAEPWFENGVIPDALAERSALFTADRLVDHINFARRTGLSEVYLWGVEWWYDLAQRGDASLWDAAREEMGEK